MIKALEHLPVDHLLKYCGIGEVDLGGKTRERKRTEVYTLFLVWKK